MENTNVWRHRLVNQGKLCLDKCIYRGGKTATKLKQQLPQMHRSDCVAVGDVATIAT